jgi:hypothetical protein
VYTERAGRTDNGNPGSNIAFRLGGRRTGLLTNHHLTRLWALVFVCAFEVSPVNGQSYVVTTLAGAYLSEDNVLATQTDINPYADAGLAADHQGNVYILEESDIRRISLRLSPVSAGCQYLITPSAISVPFQGGTATISVSTMDTCAWWVGSGSSWVLPDTIGASGSGTIHIVVSPNPGGSPRATDFNVAGQSFQVTQSAFGCDINNDGIVNVTDVQMSIMLALSSSVSVADVSIVVNAALGEGCSAS